MKYPVSTAQVGVLRADQKTARLCYNESLKINRKNGRVTDGFAHRCCMTVLDPRDGFEDQYLDRHPQSVEETRTVVVDAAGRKFKIGTSLTPQGATDLVTLLMANQDVFAWTTSDITGLDPSLMSHKLSLNPNVMPIAQRKRKMGEEKRKTVKVETDRLIEAGFIKEDKYPTWLANVVMVRKSNGKWRVCTDYTDLNKHYPKDAYPLPNIDLLMDRASGYKVMSLMDAFSDYK